MIGTPSSFFLILGIILCAMMKYAEWRKSVTVVSPLVQSRRQHSRKMAVNTVYLPHN